MSFAIASRRPVGWAVLVALLGTVLFWLSYIAGANLLFSTNSAGHRGSQTAVVLHDEQIMSVEAAGWSWKGVAIATAVVATVIGVTVATGGFALLAYTLAAPAAAASAGVAWTAGAGALIGGTTLAGNSLQYLSSHR